MKIVFNGDEHELSAEISIADFLRLHQLDSRHVAVEVNLELAPRGRHADWMLKDGDRVEVVTLVGGG